MNTLRNRFARLAILFGLAATISLSAFGQTVTGSIYGTIADTSGAIIPQASVTVTNTDTGQSLSKRSNSSGGFVFPVLDPGNYKISTSIAGFESVTQNDLRLAANQNINASFKLKTGSVET